MPVGYRTGPSKLGKKSIYDNPYLIPIFDNFSNTNKDGMSLRFPSINSKSQNPGKRYSYKI